MRSKSGPIQISDALLRKCQALYAMSIHDAKELSHCFVTEHGQAAAVRGLPRQSPE